MAKRREPSRGAPAPAAKPMGAPRPPRPPVAVAAPALPWTAHLLPIAGVAALAVAVYLPSIDGQFVYDDPNAITQSTLVRSLTPLIRFARLSTRPLTDFSFAINYAIGAYTPRSYHVTGMLLHALNAVLLYLLAVRTLGLPALAARYGAWRQWIALAAAALFAVHPLASEAVAYVSSRSEVLSSTFYLAAVLAFVIAATTGARTAVAGIFFATGIAGLCKESAASIPVALLLYDALFLAGADRHRRGLHWRLIGVSLLPILIGGVLFGARALLSPSGLGAYGATAGLGFDRFPWWQYLFTQFGVIVSYLRLTLVPVGQTFDYDIPLATSLFAPEVWLPLLLLIGIVVCAWRWRRSEPLFAFAVGWTLLILAPTSSLMPIADLMVERRMYLALAGLMLFAAAGLWDLAGLALAARARQIAYAVGIAALVAGASVLTLGRAALWGEEIALHEDGVAKAPGNPRTRLNLGVTYLNRGQVDKALDSLQIAKQLYDRGESVQAFPRIGAFIHYNLGAVLYTRKQYDAAEPQLRRSLELGGQYLALRPMGNFLLARIALTRNDYKTAITRLQEALKFQDNAEWRIQLADAYLKSGDRNMAIATLQNALRKYPDHPRATAALRKIQSGT